MSPLVLPALAFGLSALMLFSLVRWKTITVQICR
jgi:hypothetical protein